MDKEISFPILINLLYLNTMQTKTRQMGVFLAYSFWVTHMARFGATNTFIEH